MYQSFHGRQPGTDTFACISPRASGTLDCSKKLLSTVLLPTLIKYQAKCGMRILFCYS